MRSMTNKSIRVAWISNILFEPYLHDCLNDVFLTNNYGIIYDYICLGEIDQKIDVIRDAEVIVVYCNFFTWYPDLLNKTDVSKNKIVEIYRDVCKRIQRLLFCIKTNRKGRVIWFGFEDYYANYLLVFGERYLLSGLIDKLNLYLCEVVEIDVLVDLKRIVALCGIYNSYSRKGWYRWDAPYSEELIRLMAQEIYKQYQISIGQTKKCVVIDCDNVLWGGSLAEEGIEGIKLGKNGFGRVYHDFQKFIYMLYTHGVILAICSKNNLNDVLRVFREHDNMILKEEYISCFMVNWESKTLNIERISRCLNIDLDSIVFVDDSLHEVERVKGLLPKVTTIQFHRYMDYSQFSCFNLEMKYDLNNAEKRTQTYQTNVLRNELRETTENHDEYIRSLNVKMDIHKALLIELSRIAELTQRTNKCTNGQRYTLGELKKRIGAPEVHLYSVVVSDRFSDLGLVGAIEIEGDCLTMFSLSCRAIGLNVEKFMIDYIANNHFINSVAFFSTN